MGVLEAADGSAERPGQVLDVRSPHVNAGRCACRRERSTEDCHAAIGIDLMRPDAASGAERATKHLSHLHRQLEPRTIGRT